jgi:hypothetical protein
VRGLTSPWSDPCLETTNDVGLGHDLCLSPYPYYDPGVSGTNLQNGRRDPACAAFVDWSEGLDLVKYLYPQEWPLVALSGFFLERNLVMKGRANVMQNGKQSGNETEMETETEIVSESAIRSVFGGDVYASYRGLLCVKIDCT